MANHSEGLGGRGGKVLVTHPSAVAESWVQIPTPCKYCKATSAAAASEAVAASTFNSSRSSEKKKKAKTATKIKNKICTY